MPLPSWTRSWIPSLAPALMQGLRDTWDVRIHDLHHIQSPRNVRPPVCIFALWHGRQLPATAVIRTALRIRPITVMTSASRDGQLQAEILHRLGLHTVTGSSSERGAQALLGLARVLRKGSSALLAVDGPRGPAYCAKSGAVVLSRMTRTPIVPIGVRASRIWTMPNTWDGFALPLPGARVEITLGSPIPPPRSRARQDLHNTLHTLQRNLAWLNQTTPTRLSPLHTQ